MYELLPSRGTTDRSAAVEALRRPAGRRRARSPGGVARKTIRRPGQAYHEHVALHATLHWINSEPLGDTAGEPALVQATIPATSGLTFLAGSAPYTTSSFQGWPMAYFLATVVFAVGLTVGAPHARVQFPAIDRRLLFDRRASDRHAAVRRSDHERAGLQAGRQCAAGRRRRPCPHRAAHRTGCRVARNHLRYRRQSRPPRPGCLQYRIFRAAVFFPPARLTARLEKKSDVGVQTSESANQKSEVINHQFAVRTPTAIITDLGTEFGVEVDRDGSTKSYVLVGSVRVEPANHGNGTKDRSVVLHARDRAAVQKTADAAEADMTVEHNLAKPDHLVWPSELAGMARQQKLQRLARRKQSDEQIRNDPALVAYYDFQCRSDAPGELHAVGPAATALDGVIQRTLPQYFYSLHSVAGNVLAGKPIEVSSSYDSDPTWAVFHLTDRSEASARIFGRRLRSTHGDPRIQQSAKRRSPLEGRRSGGPTGDDQEFAHRTGVRSTPPTTKRRLPTRRRFRSTTPDMPTSPSRAPAGTQCLFLDFGDRTEYYPGGEWKLPAGVRTVEVQAFASPPALVSPTTPPWWTGGRESGKTALQFDGVNTRVTINVPQRLSQMTLAAWMTVDFIDDRSPSSGLLTSADSNKPGVPAEGIRWAHRPDRRNPVPRRRLRRHDAVRPAVAKRGIAAVGDIWPS